MCADTLLSDTAVLTPTFAKAQLTISLFSGFHFVPVIGILGLSSISHYLSLFSFIQSLDIG